MRSFSRATSAKSALLLLGDTFSFEMAMSGGSTAAISATGREPALAARLILWAAATRTSPLVCDRFCQGGWMKEKKRYSKTLKSGIKAAVWQTVLMDSNIKSSSFFLSKWVSQLMTSSFYHLSDDYEQKAWVHSDLDTYEYEETESE